MVTVDYDAQLRTHIFLKKNLSTLEDQFITHLFISNAARCLKMLKAL